MSSEDMVVLQQRWRGFTAEKAKAKRVMQERIEENNAEITRLREENIRMNSAFDRHWAEERARLQQARDEAVMEQMAAGRSAQSILKDLGSNNTVWIYDLRSRVQAAGRIPQQPNANTYFAPEPQQHQLQQQAAQLEETVEPQTWGAGVIVEEAEPSVDVSGITWLHHTHQGVVGWLLSSDHQYVKKHGAAGTDFEGEWFVCSRDHEFIAGNRELFESTAKGEVTRRRNMLTALLEDRYEGKIKLVDNPFTS
jgi:hypothetical protein